MVDATHISYPAADRSYFALLKKDIHTKARDAGFDNEKLASLDIILAELTSNLHKYAVDGEILVGFGADVYGEYIEIITIDNGPGIADPAKMLQDGMSTGATLGHGLGSIKRGSDVFDIFSLKGWGTIVLSRLYKTIPKTNITLSKGVDIKPLVVAKTGETISGDGTYIKVTGKTIKMLVADGLGHGKEANLAVNEAVKSFRACADDSPVDIIRQLHQDIRKTRGMVGTVVVFNLETKQLQLVGVGNISSKFMHLGGVVKNHVSYNGIIGHNIPNTMNSQTVAFADYSLLVCCSDGIRSRWDIAKYLGINKCDSAILAAAVFKDHARRTDDMSVIVVKLR